MLDNKETKKAEEITKLLKLHKKFLQKFLTQAFFLLAPAVTSRIPWLLQAFFLLAPAVTSKIP